MMPVVPQIVYILTNPAMPNYVKVGRTNNLERRLRDLDNTSTPLPFVCFFAAEVTDALFVEKKLHDAFLEQRVRNNREFFELEPARVASALELAMLKDVTPLNDVTETADDAQALNKAKKRGEAFNFDMVEIPVGTVLTYINDESLTAVVSGNRKIIFEGEETSLSAAAVKIRMREGYKGSSANGTLFWEYEGETMSERYRRYWEENSDS